MGVGTAVARFSLSGGPRFARTSYATSGQGKTSDLSKVAYAVGSA